MELGATILTFGSPFCTSIGTGLRPALTREKLPVTCSTLLSKRCCSSSAVPITVTLTAGGSPTGTRLEQRGQHLAQPVWVEVAQQLAFVGDGDLAQLLAQYEHHRVGLHRQAKPGAMTRPHSLADRALLRQRQHAAGRQDLVPAHDYRAVVQR